MPRRALAVFAVLWALTACTGEARTNDLAARTVVFGADTGTFADGDEQIRWTRASSDSGVLVSETLTFGTDGTGTRRLLFTTDGALRAFDESRTQTMQASDRTPTPMRVDVRFAFDGNRTIHAEKRVDGRATDVRDYESTNVRRHADAVRAVVWRTPPRTPPHTP